MRKYCLPRHREPRLEDLRRVRDGRGEELLEVLVLGQLVVPGLPPLVDGLRGEYYQIIIIIKYNIMNLNYLKKYFSSPLRGK